MFITIILDESLYSAGCSALCSTAKRLKIKLFTDKKITPRVDETTKDVVKILYQISCINMPL